MTIEQMFCIMSVEYFTVNAKNPFLSPSLPGFTKLGYPHEPVFSHASGRVVPVFFTPKFFLLPFFCSMLQKFFGIVSRTQFIAISHSVCSVYRLVASKFCMASSRSL